MKGKEYSAIRSYSSWIPGKTKQCKKVYIMPDKIHSCNTIILTSNQVVLISHHLETSIKNLIRTGNCNLLKKKFECSFSEDDQPCIRLIATDDGTVRSGLKSQLQWWQWDSETSKHIKCPYQASYLELAVLKCSLL